MVWVLVVDHFLQLVGTHRLFEINAWQVREVIDPGHFALDTELDGGCDNVGLEVIEAAERQKLFSFIEEAVADLCSTGATELSYAKRRTRPLSWAAAGPVKMVGGYIRKAAKRTASCFLAHSAMTNVGACRCACYEETNGATLATSSQIRHGGPHFILDHQNTSTRF